ncbi:MAG: hypothetical protein MAG451_00951 [Anaerolineales bacterium]|nr:hypothetical protein [Anaerolineales bacterium]
MLDEMGGENAIDALGLSLRQIGEGVLMHDVQVALPRRLAALPVEVHAHSVDAVFRQQFHEVALAASEI